MQTHKSGACNITSHTLGIAVTFLNSIVGFSIIASSSFWLQRPTVSSVSCSKLCSRDGAKVEQCAKEGESAQLHFNIMRISGFQVSGPHSIEMLVQTTSSVLFSGVCISLSGWHPYCPLVTGWECLIYVSHPLPFPDL